MIGAQTEQSAMWRSLGGSNSRALPISERARLNPSPAAGSRSADVRAPRNMDGKGAWRDNVFVERLCRSVKYEEVYLRAYDSVREARASIGRYLGFYNNRRPHSSLDGVTPDQAYFNSLPLRSAA
jgi:transposase InsO family protein